MIYNLRGNNTKLSNIEFRDCANGPVIRIASDEANDVIQDEITYKIIEFTNLDFSYNNETEINSDFSGGALYIDQRSNVTIYNSTFKYNYAEQVLILNLNFLKKIKGSWYLLATSINIDHRK